MEQDVNSNHFLFLSAVHTFLFELYFVSVPNGMSSDSSRMVVEYARVILQNR